MRRENVMARMLRALSGATQERTAEAIGVHPSLIGQIEMDQTSASPEHLEGMAELAGLTLPEAEELLAHYDALRRSSRWRGGGLEAALHTLTAKLRDELTRAYEELLALPVQDGLEEDDPDELWALLEKYPETSQFFLIEMGEEYQNPALQRKLTALAAEAAERDPEQAAHLERLAAKIAETTGPKAG
jgi:transcriptional regulator with XRE-family HTH domain